MESWDHVYERGNDEFRIRLACEDIAAPHNGAGTDFCLTESNKNKASACFAHLASVLIQVFSSRGFMCG